MLCSVHDLWVSMAGLAGVGKSTLMERIGATLRRQHVPVDTFGEEELFTRSQFTRVADGFRTKHYASPEEFEGAYEAWLRTLPAATAAIMDWNPASMAGDLPWAAKDPARLRQHLQTVYALAGGRVLLLHLQAPAEVTIERASAERGEKWLARSDRIACSSGHDQPDRSARVLAEATRHAAQTRDELCVATEAGRDGQSTLSMLLAQPTKPMTKPWH